MYYYVLEHEKKDYHYSFVVLKKRPSWGFHVLMEQQTYLYNHIYNDTRKASSVQNARNPKT